jgi:hypothetical protein
MLAMQSLLPLEPLPQLSFLLFNGVSQTAESCNFDEVHITAFLFFFVVVLFVFNIIRNIGLFLVGRITKMTPNDPHLLV